MPVRFTLLLALVLSLCLAPTLWAETQPASQPVETAAPAPTFLAGLDQPGEAAMTPMAPSTSAINPAPEACGYGCFVANDCWQLGCLDIAKCRKQEGQQFGYCVYL
jgi:hypothetical protein